MHTAFTILCRDSSVEFQFSGRSDSGQPPLLTFQQEPGFAVAFLGRLHYTDELLLPPEDTPAALVLAAYRRDGVDGLTRLEGDFALALWDERANLIVTVRDPLGGYPIYWTHGPEGVAFSTSMRPLVDRLPRQTLDPEYLADFLMLPMGSMPDFAGGRCVYQGVHRQAAGSLAMLRLPAGRVQERVYWNWLERQIDPGSDRLEEISSCYAELLREAVRQRMQGRTAAHLSGGMDSTAVALLAREAVAAGQAEGPLHTLSLVYKQLPGLNQETPYLEGVLARHLDLMAHRIPADELLDYDSFVDPPLHDEPYSGLWRLALDRATIDAAARCGAATMLTGVGADEMLDPGPYHIGGLLRRGRLAAAWAEANRWARADNCSLWKILGPFGFANLLPAGMRVGLKTWLRGGFAEWERQTQWTVAPWMAPGFARRHDLHGRAVANLRRRYGGNPNTAVSLALSAIGCGIGDFHRWHLAAPRGLAVAHPFRDPRILCFSLGVQARLAPHPERQKPVLAEAMRDVLPEEIRNRRRKGNFNEVYFLGLSRNLRRLEALVENAPDEGMFDRARLLGCLRKAALGHAADVHALNRLNLTLSFLRWLSQRPAWQAEQVPSEVIQVGGPAAAPCRA